MGLHLNVLGDRYDDSEPCFCTTPSGMVYNRVTRKWFRYAALLIIARRRGHEWQPNEIGVPSTEWVRLNMMGWEFGPIADGGPDPTPIPNPIKGPFSAEGTQFWINSDNCCVGFDVNDGDPDADVWLSGSEVCEMDIPDLAKISISAHLVAEGCPPMMCITAAGNVKKAYSREVVQAKAAEKGE